VSTPATRVRDVNGQGDPTRMEPGKLPHSGALCARALARAPARASDAALVEAITARPESLPEVGR